MSEDDAKVLREYKSGLAHLQDGVVEAMTDLMDTAETWLNQNRAPHGYTFGWFEGEFFLAHERWWNDQYAVGYDHDDVGDPVPVDVHGHVLPRE